MNNLLLISVIVATIFLMFGINQSNSLEGYSTRNNPDLRGNSGGYGWINPFYLYRMTYLTPYDYSSKGQGYPYNDLPYEYHKPPRKLYRVKTVF